MSALALVRELLTFLPQNNMEDPPLRPTRIRRPARRVAAVHRARAAEQA